MGTRAGLRVLPRGSSVPTASGWMVMPCAKNTPLRLARWVLSSAWAHNLSLVSLSLSMFPFLSLHIRG